MTFPGEALDEYLTHAPSLDEEGEEDTMTQETDPMLKLYAALETFRDHMGGPVRPNRQGQHGAMYADLAQLDDATDTPLREAGLVVAQATRRAGGRRGVDVREAIRAHGRVEFERARLRGGSR